MDWEEREHPRHPDGRFREKGLADFVRSIKADLVGRRIYGVELELLDRGGYTVLEKIAVPKGDRGRGTGTAVMQALIEEADRRGVTLALSPSNMYGGNTRRLQEFYRRFGFESNTGPRGRLLDPTVLQAMVRRPRPREGTADWSHVVSERLGAASGYVDEGGRFESQERLEETIAKGVRERYGRRLAGGAVAGTRVHDFEMPDGSVRQVVRKQYRVESDREVAAEVAVGLIGLAIGAPVPAIARDPDDPQGLYMELLAGQPPFREPSPREAGTVAGRLIGLLDLLSSNKDRHGGNWLLLDDFSVAGIDHGIVVLDRSADWLERQGRWPWNGFTDHLLESPQGPGGGGLRSYYLAENDWHPADLGLVEQRLYHLFGTERYQRLAAQAEADDAIILGRLAAIRAKATGTVRRLT